MNALPLGDNLSFFFEAENEEEADMVQSASEAINLLYEIVEKPLRRDVDVYDKSTVAVSAFNLANSLISLDKDYNLADSFVSWGIELLDESDIPLGNKHPLVIGYNARAILAILNADYDVDEIINYYEKSIKLLDELSMDGTTDYEIALFNMSSLFQEKGETEKALSQIVSVVHSYFERNPGSEIPVDYEERLKEYYKKVHSGNYDKWFNKEFYN
jgi:tetratricopeptide (TPR) repeat protein